MIELEDRPWFPSMLRRFQMEHIGALASLAPVYGPFEAYLRRVQGRRLPQVDLCSGSGLPAIRVFRRSGVFKRLTLTDRYPQWGRNAPEGVTYLPEAVDATAVEFRPETCYTMFNAFHHFSDAEQRRMVGQVHAAGAEAYFVEVLEPTALCLLKVIASSTVGVLLLAPFIRPFSLTRLLLTYVAPVNVLTITWDGVVSVLRSRTAGQYHRRSMVGLPFVTVHRLRGRWLPLTVIRVSPSP